MTTQFSGAQLLEIGVEKKSVFFVCMSFVVSWPIVYLWFFYLLL